MSRPRRGARVLRHGPGEPGHRVRRRTRRAALSTFFALLRDAYLERGTYLDGAPERARDTTVLLYVHGYNNGFTDVAERTAALAWRTSAAPAIMFGWPSRHSVLGYVTDLDQARWAAPDLRTFLEALSGAVPPGHTNVIVHSMGSQALAHALDGAPPAAAWPTSRRMRTLTFVDPDYDEALFVRDGLPLYRQFASRLTLYGTRGDVPLRLAAFLRSGYPRAGQVRDGTFRCPAAMDCIDVSGVLPRGFLHHFDVIAPNSPLTWDFARPGSGPTRDAAARRKARTSAAAARAALAAEFGAENVLGDETALVTRPVRVGDYFMKAQIDIVLRDGAYRAMLSALVADTREQIEGASRLVVIDDSGRWTAQWERLVAVARRLAAAAAPPRSAGARR